MGRLRPGLSLAAADARFQVIWPQILRATAELSIPASARATSRSRRASSPAPPAGRRCAPSFGDALWLLFGLVGLLLVTACATVANLLLAAAAGRRHELALRLALGAGRRRIAQQLFVEGLLLAVAGGALALVFSNWATDLLVGLLSTSYDSVVVDVDARLGACSRSSRSSSAGRRRCSRSCRSCAVAPRPGAMLDSGTRQTGSRHRARGGARSSSPVQVAISLTLVGGLDAVRAQPVAARLDRHRLRAREPAGGWRRRDVAVERTGDAARRWRARSDGLLRRAAAAASRNAGRAVGEPLLQGADQQRARIVVGHLRGRWRCTPPPSPACAPISMPSLPASSRRWAPRSSRGGTSNGAIAKAPRGS